MPYLIPIRRTSLRRAMASTVVVATFVASFVAALAATASADPGVFSITGCEDAGVRRADPIVAFGQPRGGHLHQVVANVETRAHSIYDEMIVAETTCALSPDTSAYWAPALLDRRGRVVDLRSANAYYRASSSRSGKIVAFPQDLRIVAGAPDVRAGSDKLVGWSCDDASPYRAKIPNCKRRPGTYVKAHIVFPSCWDGVNLDSVDHRSHMAYPDGARCPATHPVLVPRLSMHFTWNAVNGRKYNLSSDEMFGTGHGRSLHSDFWNTWNQEALEDLVEACLNGGKSCKGMNDRNFTSRTGEPIEPPRPCTAACVVPSVEPAPMVMATHHGASAA